MCMQYHRVIRENGRMPRTPSVVPGLRKVDLPEVRQAIPALHAYLRQCVLDGTLTPGTKLSQVALADQLGVSRTPLREVLRMLQEEGLVEIEPNQRTRVAGLDPQELDEVYASRILLETLALSMTLHGFTPANQRQAKQLLTAMPRARRMRADRPPPAGWGGGAGRPARGGGRTTAVSRRGTVRRRRGSPRSSRSSSNDRSR